MDVDLSAGVAVGHRRLAAFAMMAKQMVQPDVEATLSAVVGEAKGLKLGDAVGVLLVEGRSITAAAASEPDVERANQLQLQCGEGPGVDTIMRRRNLIADDLRLEDDWERWGPQATRLGWLSVLSVRISDGETFGALNLYSRQSSGFDSNDLGVAEAFALHAAVAVTVARERSSLAKAVAARHLIGQAQGILMERYQLDAEQAFSVLRRYSSHCNRKLRDVAADLVQHRQLPQEAAGDVQG